MNPWLALLAGGAAGTLSRYFLASFFQRLSTPSFPWGILAVNTSGCFLMGFFALLIERKGFAGPEGRLLLMTGFCGAFTTFSALIFDTAALAREGRWGAAVLNITASLLLGAVFFRLGELSAQRV